MEVMLLRGFLPIAIKKLNAMITSDRFVQIIAIDETGITIQNVSSVQKIDRFGRVLNANYTHKMDIRKRVSISNKDNG